MRPEPSALDRVSKELFNQKRLLSVAAVVLAMGDDSFMQVDVASALGLPSVSSVQAPIELMFTLGFIGSAAEPTSRGHALERRPSYFWLLANELIDRYPVSDAGSAAEEGIGSRPF